MLTKGRFISMITEKFSGYVMDSGNADLMSYRKAGWIEEQDVIGKDEELDRRTAARIIHMFMKKILGIRDLKDITPAYGLKDLFDCRVCAAHIAEVYIRGIIQPIDMNGMLIFDVFRSVSEEEAEKMIAVLNEVWQNYKSDSGE